jgi:hypothetical protein
MTNPERMQCARDLLIMLDSTAMRCGEQADQRIASLQKLVSYETYWLVLIRR